MSKVIIFAAPSGSGKSTIKDYVMQNSDLNLHFSISATTREPRGKEKNGVDYFFMSPEEFRQRIANGEFLEYEEVYPDKFYGTLKSQIDKMLEEGKNVIVDVDVKGATNIKQAYGKRALSVFIQPPSLSVLLQRLESRGTDAPEVIETRLKRAEYELSFADKFDEVVINDILDIAQVETESLIEDFLDEE